MIILVYIIGLILGIVIFGFLNKVFDIYYFGFKGIISTFFGCWFAGVIIVLLFGFAAKWLILIFAVLWLLAKIFKRNDKGESDTKQDGEQENTPGPKSK
jgi:uncharacterized membrane protein